MFRKLVPREERYLISKQVLTRTILGGILGAVIGVWYKNGVLTIPVLWSIFEAIPISSVLAGTLLGILIGGVVAAILESHRPRYNSNEYDSNEYDPIEYDSHINTNDSLEQVVNDTNKEAKLQLREEHLDISKERVKTCEVNMHKEVFTEEKTITVSTIREELVIEKKAFDAEDSNEMDEHIEIIRIPISEEKIEITKHPVILEDVAVYTHKFQKIQCIEKTLKKEKLHVESTGDAKIVNKKSEEE